MVIQALSRSFGKVRRWYLPLALLVAISVKSFHHLLNKKLKELILLNATDKTTTVLSPEIVNLI
jgi:hypothetical protein